MIRNVTKSAKNVIYLADVSSGASGCSCRGVSCVGVVHIAATTAWCTTAGNSSIISRIVESAENHMKLYDNRDFPK